MLMTCGKPILQSLHTFRKQIAIWKGWAGLTAKIELLE